MRQERAWTLAVIVVVLSFAGACIAKLRLSDIPNQAIGHSNKPPELGSPRDKVVGYEASGPPGASATLSYLDESGDVRRVSTTLPWQTVFRTNRLTLPTGLVIQTTSGHVSCRITINGEQKDEHSSAAPDAAVSCNVAVS